MFANAKMSILQGYIVCATILANHFLFRLFSWRLHLCLTSITCFDYSIIYLKNMSSNEKEQRINCQKQFYYSTPIKTTKGRKPQTLLTVIINSITLIMTNHFKSKYKRY